MSTIFVDTGYYVALLDRADNLHDRAAAITRTLTAGGASFMTSEHVLGELLTFMSKAGPHARRSAVEYVDEILADPAVLVVSQTSQIFKDALALYRARLDKNYSMTDCASMVICRAERITEVLSADHDFVQEGLTILL